VSRATRVYPYLQYLMFEVIHIPMFCPFETFTATSAREIRLIVADRPDADRPPPASRGKSASHREASEARHFCRAGSSVHVHRRMEADRRNSLGMVDRRVLAHPREGWEVHVKRTSRRS